MITKENLEEINKDLASIPVKGKEYVTVDARVRAFRQLIPDGTISTEILSNENGVVTMKATIQDETGRILSTGLSYEKESNGFINKTSYIENCVPLDTEILTLEGWKYYYQIEKGDMALSLNMETNRIEFTPIKEINIHQDRPLVELKTSRFNVRCTPQHKWVVRSQYKDISKVETLHIKTSEKIVQNVLQEGIEPSSIGRRLGWLMCDCEITRTQNGMPSTAYISQSKYTTDVVELFGEPSYLANANTAEKNWKDNYEWVIKGELVRYILGHFKISTYKDLSRAMLEASLEDVAGCYQSMMLADGEDRGFSSTYIELVEAVQIMCARLGIATGKIKSRLCKLSTKPIYTLSIKKTDGAWFSEIRVVHIPPADVWCPTTENGTWFMRQGNFVTLTSNCETSAVGRALGFLGIGINTSIASAEEVGNAIENQPIDAVKVKIIRQDIEKGKTDEEKLLKWLKIKRIEDMTEGMFRKYAEKKEEKK